MKKLFTAMLMCLSIVLSLASCNKDAVAPTDSAVEAYQATSATNHKQDISVVDGHVRFQNVAVLRGVLNSFRGVNKMETWEKRFPNFKSMRKAYDELVTYDIGKALTDGSINSYKGVYRIVEESDGDKSYERAIFDQGLSTVLNTQGVFQIGDSLYRISEQRTIVVPISYQAEVNDENPTHGLVRAVTHRYNSKNARLRSDHDDYNVQYSPAGLALRRFRGIGVSTNYAFSWDQHWEAGYKVWHQRHNWWGWGSEYADYIYLSCKVTVNGQLRYDVNGTPSQGAAGAAGLYENGFTWSEGWTSASVGTVQVEYNWHATGNGIVNGSPAYQSNSNVWEENI
jgi:hypothetical protein